VKPKFVDENRFILKPCVKWGVKPESYTFKTELFGPLLAVVCMDDLEQGIQLVNDTEYGLTSGLHSLDEEEQLRWKNSIVAGNLYINRGITGAIVSRQPFGGMKLSSFGGGIKAGGPNYVSSFVNMTEIAETKPTVTYEKTYKLLASILNLNENSRFQSAIESYLRNWKVEFSKVRDTHHLVGEQNTFRYLPLKSMILRVQDKDQLCDIFMVLVAANIAKTPITLSLSSTDYKIEVLKNCIRTECSIKIQSENEFLKELSKYERIRTCSTELSENFYRQAAILGKHIATAKPLTEGRVELLHYVKEQSIAFEYHRYGSITGDTNYTN